MPAFNVFSLPTMPDVTAIPRIWVSGSHKNIVKVVGMSATTTSGVATYYLTEDGLVGGVGIFTNVYKPTANFWVDDNTAQYQFGSYTVSGDNRTLTISVTKLGASSANALLNLIGGLVSVVTGIVFNTAPNGTVIYMQVQGD